MVHEITQTEHAKWDQFVSQNPSAQIYHLSAWREILEKSFGLETFYLFSEEKGAARGILPLTFQKSAIFGRYLVSLPFVNVAGVCASDPAGQEELIQAAKQKADQLGADYLELRHLSNDISTLPAREHKVTFVLSLPASSEILWKGMKDKVRNEARKGEKERLVFQEGGAEMLDSFYRLFALNMRNLGSPVFSQSYFENIARCFPEESRIYTVLLNNRPVAAGFTLSYKGKMEIPWAASDWKYLAAHPNVFLYWNILRRACELKMERFDFGRCSRGGGTYQFKRQWGGEEIPLYWYYYSPSQKKDLAPGAQPPFAHRLASKIWKWLPIPIATRLGPSISKHLPV